jgi:prepilin-type N-terminal cleavage/methylation domain-containing protein
MRRGVTLIELIITLVIASILSIGMFTAIKTVAVQSQKAKARSIHSLDTQTALDQIAALFYHRVPQSAIGYNASTGNHYGLSEISDKTTTLEWLGTFNEVVLDENVSGFVDMASSSKANLLLHSPGTNTSNLEIQLQTKWGNPSLSFDNNDTALVFAGSLDQGVLGGRFGWHGKDASDVLTFSGDSNASIFALKSDPIRIYEKYYLVDSAYAVTRSQHVAELNATCFNDLRLRDLNNTLLLFYNYRPWKGETFCGDNRGNPTGGVTILAENIIYFRVETSGVSVRISIEAEENINGSETPVRISKQKVVF